MSRMYTNFVPFSFHRWTVVTVYHLEGVSGKSVMQHPEAQLHHSRFGDEAFALHPSNLLTCGNFGWPQ
ncbi:MAG: hypothetical protein QOF89_1108 [Acidobacteriota bacterium]|nr:hypothetical protein [Acidobacteriota bacterium]